MTNELELSLRVTKLLIVAIGLAIVYLAARGYLRTNAPSLLFLAIGFALITGGSVFAGTLFEIFPQLSIFFLPPPHTLLHAVIIESTVQLAGFLVILYSIFGRHS